MTVKVLDFYTNKTFGFKVQVAGLSEVLGVKYVAFKDDDNGVTWNSEEQFLRHYLAKPKYKAGDILEFSDKERYGAKVRVLVLGGNNGLRVGEWGDRQDPSDAPLEYYLRKIDDNPRVLGNYKHLLASANFGDDK